MQRRTPLLAGGAVAALVAASFLTALPASAAQPQPPVIFLNSSVTNWVVPAGVHSIDFTAIGGAGGDGGGGVNGGDGGAGATVTGTLLVTPGQSIDVWAGAAGDDGAPEGAFGAGGDGYRTGGDGANGGDEANAGGGGGGSSAIQIVGTPEASVVAGGGGGGGGRGGFFATCPGGAGGDGAAAGEDAVDAVLCNAVQDGGAAGVDEQLPGGDAEDTLFPDFFNAILGGSGGGGAGGGEPGTLNQAPVIDNSGGGGGGGGASTGGVVEIEAADGDGIVIFNYALEFTTATTAVAAPNPATQGQKIVVTATVDNQETGADPTGTVDFGIAGCAAIALVGGTAGDGLATATCEYTAGAPSSITYNIIYSPLLGSPFGPSATTLKIDVVAALAATGLGASSLLPVGGAALVLLLGGALLVLRRRTA